MWNDVVRGKGAAGVGYISIYAQKLRTRSLSELGKYRPICLAWQDFALPVKLQNIIPLYAMLYRKFLDDKNWATLFWQRPACMVYFANLDWVGYCSINTGRITTALDSGCISCTLQRGITPLKEHHTSEVVNLSQLL